MSKIEILYRPAEEFKNRSDTAIHTFKPTFNELIDHIETAIKDGFPLVVVYGNNKQSASNIFNGNSTWNRLRRIFDDVRYGEVGFKHGTSIGDGFTIYLVDCEVCQDKGYLEATHDDNCAYIEACQDCNAFTEGSMGDCTNSDSLARDQAIKEGYKLNKSGKILI